MHSGEISYVGLAVFRSLVGASMLC